MLLFQMPCPSVSIEYLFRKIGSIKWFSIVTGLIGKPLCPVLAVFS